VAKDADLRRCPKCNMKLWLRALARKIRCHDRRHTTASLLVMAGANPAAVQRILRQGDPRITTGVYGHLAPDYLRREIDLFSFGMAADKAELRWRTSESPSHFVHWWCKARKKRRSRDPSVREKRLNSGALPLRAQRESNPQPSA
jgi:hypothetical protein